MDFNLHTLSGLLEAIYEEDLKITISRVSSLNALKLRVVGKTLKIVRLFSMTGRPLDLPFMHHCGEAIQELRIGENLRLPIADKS